MSENLDRQLHYPPGLVGVISGDLGRYAAFYSCMTQMKLPPGSKFTWIRGNGFAANRNLVVNSLRQPGYEHLQWVWFLDDDQPFEPDLLLRLLDRNVDMVQPLISTRKPPYRPYAFRRDPLTGEYRSPAWEEIPISGMSEWDAIGAGCCLVKRKVFDAIGYPWYEEGKLTADCVGEDLYFCEKARKLGFKCYIDSDHRSGHITTTEVWPTPHEGQWVIDFNMYHDVVVRVPNDIGRDAAFIEIADLMKSV